MFKTFSTLTFLINILAFCNGKYVEGYLKTMDDWHFIARFCFLSGRGRYEYEIEFERRFGEPQLLLYFDDKSQWPSVYKSDKTCIQKLAVLSRIDNQIVTLSARQPHHMLSGCTLRTIYDESPTIKPTPSYKNTNNDNNSNKNDDNNNKTPLTSSSELDPNYYDQFLKTSTTPYKVENYTELDYVNLLDQNSTDTNETELKNSSAIYYIPYKFDIGYANTLENSSNFQSDVEELFKLKSDNVNDSRIRRSPSIPPITKQGKVIVNCKNVGGFSTARERWWYIAIANCGTGKGIDIKYKFRMTNGPPGDFWHEHFSADEMYVPPILLTECLAYTFLLLAIFLCAIELKTRHLFHCTYRLFAFSALAQWIGIIVQGVAWTKYAITGLGPYTTLGGMLMGTSEVSFLSLMLLMAKGYTITRARLSPCSTVKLTVFINIYIIAFISLYIYQAEAFDPGEVLNLYESPAGFGLTGLRCGAWIIFLISIAATVRKYPEKGAFYYPFGLLGSLWILGGPVLTILGLLLDAWVRESVMCGALGAIAFGGHATFLWLTWPSRANKSFPYHVRTNHVGIAIDSDRIDYPRHAYEPTNELDQNIVIPLSRRTDELLSGVYNQYIRERDFYESNSTPISHISFPQIPTISSASEMNIRTAQNEFIQTEANESTESIISRKNSALHNSSNFDSQVDSGHPSLENSGSPVETESSSVVHTPVIDENIHTNSITNKTLKNNPFIVNGMSRGPNKVILEPIDHPITTSNELTSNNVPKHLFAIKKQNNIM